MRPPVPGFGSIVTPVDPLPYAGPPISGTAHGLSLETLHWHDPRLATTLSVSLPPAAGNAAGSNPLEVTV